MGERCYEMPRTQSPLIIGGFAGGAEDFRIKDSDTTSSFESDQSLFLLIGRWGACWMQSGAGWTGKTTPGRGVSPSPQSSPAGEEVPGTDPQTPPLEGPCPSGKNAYAGGGWGVYANYV